MHESLRDRLFSLQDTAYRDFHSRLIPNIDPERVIGIRTPALRAFAKEFSETNEADEFLASLPHFFYEENNLHAMLLCEKKDFAETVRLLDAFLPHVDNWATCDLMRPKAFPGDDGELYAKICEWIASDHVYTVRFALVLLMTYFLDGAFRPEYLSLAASVKSRSLGFSPRRSQSSAKARSHSSKNAASPRGYTINRFKKRSKVTASRPRTKRICAR